MLQSKITLSVDQERISYLQLKIKSLIGNNNDIYSEHLFITLNTKLNGGTLNLKLKRTAMNAK